LSLLLTLVAIPVAYTWADGLRARTGRLIGRIRGGAPVDRGASEVITTAS